MFNFQHQMIFRIIQMLVSDSSDYSEKCRDS